MQYILQLASVGVASLVEDRAASGAARRSLRGFGCQSVWTGGELLRRRGILVLHVRWLRVV